MLDFFTQSGTLYLMNAKKKKAKTIKKPKKVVKKKNVAKKAKKVLAKKKIIKKKKVITKKVPKAPKVVRKKSPSQSVPGFPAEAFFKAKIKVIGIGGGGSSIVSEIGRSLNKATFVAADTDVRAFKKRNGIKHFLFGQELTHGLGTGLNTELARKAAEQEKDKISKLFEDQDIVIFVASLGGGLGSGATQIFAEASQNFNGITLGIFTLPFKFEGKNKYKIAVKALKELRKSLNVSITIPNERIFKVIDSSTAITDAFSMVNKNLIESLESLIDLIYSPGVINIDFADVRAILKGRGNLAFLNTAEASGKGRAEKIMEEILVNPLYQNNNFIPEKVLFNIESGGNLSMLEVDKISRVISSRNPSAKIIFGISKNSAFKNKIKTTLLTTGSPTGVEAVPEKDLVTKSKPEGVEIKESASAKAPADKVKKSIAKKKKPAKKVVKEKVTPQVQKEEEKAPLLDPLSPVFDNPLAETASAKKISIAEAAQKKAIRRNALEIQREREIEENKRSKQEEEWEIPAFLRKIKLKP